MLWWNLVDGWPQISDAVVDWYLGEKLAFEVIAASQRPFAFVVGEPKGGRLPVLACNDTRQDINGTFTVTDVGDGRKVLSGDYRSPANESVAVADLELPTGQAMLIVQWQDDDGPQRNHYLLGEPPFDFKVVRTWYEGVLHRAI